ncbi:MAG TPA: 4Fe-4S dicluster domain-containing protein [Bacilli bacterium]|nr:4Fe-4S dicluster domain-containing protein [Bacilli bacterium]HPN61562.1 4Fe-4S dicluster domain-containing protein [Bacilli bacterium]HQC74592.1 4Fe-4S dicluster domain-containing protein [Bacilli bacterium]
MKIAVLSGKGGTGKTLVSVNLAASAEKATYIDCDVEEPNGYLFFKPEGVEEEKVAVLIPQVDNKLCNGCRKCLDFCKFNALAYIVNRLIIFTEICHSCGGCLLVCPKKALSEKEKVIGKIEKGSSGPVSIYTGILNVGEASGVPIIKRLLAEKNLKSDYPIIIDCPPGSSCIVMESIKDADYCLLVAEPTLFGVHNLNMVYELVTLFNKPFGVVLNKCLLGEENPAEKFCIEKNLKILARIPFDNELGTLNSHAEIAVRKSKKYRQLFSSLLDEVTKEVQHEAITNP